MRATRVPFNLAIVLAGVLVAVVGGKARAWVAWGPVWAQHNTTYDTHVMGSSWRPVADFGADQWTNVNGSDWVYTSDNSSNNDITTGTIDGGGNVLATTTIYYNGGIINRATIIFDSAENWYLGTGVPGGSQIDGRSVSSHEFGHALGLAHTQAGNCPNGSSRSTMCSSYPTGSSYMRSLEADDANGVSSLYPDNGGGTPTSTYTPSVTPSPSVSPTPSMTLTPSATPAGGIGMPNATETPTATATPTATRTHTPTSAPSNSPTPSNTPAASPTITPQPTRTPTLPPMCMGC